MNIEEQATLYCYQIFIFRTSKDEQLFMTIDFYHACKLRVHLRLISRKSI